MDNQEFCMQLASLQRRMYRVPVKREQKQTALGVNNDILRGLQTEHAPQRCKY